MAASAESSYQPVGGLKLPDRYRVQRHIATGGMASVWCAEDRALGRTVAIKVLAERFRHDEFAVRRFQREARAAARVSAHPHVVTIFDVGELECSEDARDGAGLARAFIVMEHLSGGTVADALRVGDVRRQESMRWLREAASALDHAHRSGIVHRDIKPANFLLDGARGLHVADFGIARLLSEDTITTSGELFGTAAYLAPEQALGRPAASASDRYALAVVAFELLTGERPFRHEHFAAQARQHLEDAPPNATERERTLPAAVDPVLHRGMAKDPGDRFPTAGEFVQALEAALASTHTATTPARAPARPRPATAAGRLSTRPTNRPTTPAASGSGRPRARGLALLALVLTALGVAALSLLGQAGSPGHSSRRVLAARRSPPRVVHRLPAGASSPATRRAHVPPTPSATNPATPSATNPATATATNPATNPETTSATNPATTSATNPATASATNPTTTPATNPAATSTPAGTSAADLQLEGHALLAQGAYPAAITALRRSLGVADRSSLTYAYALYDLGRALVLSGDPQAAIPVLEQRLKIPNQTPVVQQMLDQALRAAASKRNR